MTEPRQAAAARRPEPAPGGGPGAALAPRSPLLEFQDVRISYFPRAGEVTVIPGLSFALGQGEALGLVGESGCGKSTVALSIMRFLGRTGRVTSGRILFEGQNLATMDEAAIRRLRGRRIAMVYQDPMASLNPVMTVGRQLMEVPMLHEGIGAGAARERARRMLEEVNLADPAGVFRRYPHQLSGGQQQRIVIAMALIAEPALLVMDEPTTGLDVTVEAAVLDLVRALRRRHNSAILYISHNLGTVARVCDRVGRHVRRRAGRGGRDPPRLRQPAPSLHARPPRLPADARPRQARRPAHADSRAGRLAARASDRLRVRRAGACTPIPAAA